MGDTEDRAASFCNAVPAQHWWIQCGWIYSQLVHQYKLYYIYISRYIANGKSPCLKFQNRKLMQLNLVAMVVAGGNTERTP
jgi:hypothetical protein